ncbi:MAG: hypothetical protein GX209_08800 [Epulopiscium sp.]|nr:hypothetical protein [Candidatus Epulonipiscium sp.]
MKKNNFSTLWLFAFGFLIGIVVYNTLYMSKIETLINEKEYLSAQLEDYRIKFKKLEESKQKEEIPVLNQISPVMLNNNEEFLPKNEIDQYIKVLLKNQIGKELNKIDVDLIYNGLNRRFLKFKDGEYQLQIRSIIVTDTMYIYYLAEKTSS